MAGRKLQEAAQQVALAREGPDNFAKQRVWLEALTAYGEALADIHMTWSGCNRT